MIMSIPNDLHFVRMTRSTVVTFHRLHDSLFEEPIVLERSTMAFQTTQTGVEWTSRVRMSISCVECFLSKYASQQWESKQRTTNSTHNGIWKNISALGFASRRVLGVI